MRYNIVSEADRRAAASRSSCTEEQVESRTRGRTSRGAGSPAGTEDTSCRATSESGRALSSTTIAGSGGGVNERFQEVIEPGNFPSQYRIVLRHSSLHVVSHRPTEDDNCFPANDFSSHATRPGTDRRSTAVDPEGLPRNSGLVDQWRDHRRRRDAHRRVASTADTPPVPGAVALRGRSSAECDRPGVPSSMSEDHISMARCCLRISRNPYRKMPIAPG